MARKIKNPCAGCEHLGKKTDCICPDRTKYGNTKLDIAVQIIIPGGKNVIKILPLRKAIMKMAKAWCAATSTDAEQDTCKNCKLYGTSMCEVILQDEGTLQNATVMLDGLFDKRLARIAKKQGWKL